jgi:integrase
MTGNKEAITIFSGACEQITDLAGSDLTAEEAVGAYLADLALTDLAASSIKQYRLLLLLFVRWLAGRRVHKTKHIKTEHARVWLIERKENVRQWTLLQNRCIVVSWFRWLRKNRLAPVDPDQVPRVSTPHADEIRRRRVTDAQVQRLFDGIKEDYRRIRTSGGAGCVEAGNLLAFGFLFGVGLRISEVVAVRMSDLDVPARELYVPQAKSNRPRYVSLPPSVAAYARLYLTIRRRCVRRSPYLFTTIRGGKIASHTLALRVQTIAHRHGVELTSHTGRRYCLTRLAAANPFAAQQQAGHRNLETTLLYVQESRTVLRAVVREHDPLRSPA